MGAIRKAKMKEIHCGCFGRDFKINGEHTGYLQIYKPPYEETWAVWVNGGWAEIERDGFKTYESAERYAAKVIECLTMLHAEASGTSAAEVPE